MSLFAAVLSYLAVQCYGAPTASPTPYPTLPQFQCTDYFWQIACNDTYCSSREETFCRHFNNLESELTDCRAITFFDCPTIYCTQNGCFQLSARNASNIYCGRPDDPRDANVCLQARPKESKNVVCRQGCADADFTSISNITCERGPTCERAKIANSHVNCETESCTNATIRRSTVYCGSNACEGAFVDPVNSCCDGLGCPGQGEPICTADESTASPEASTRTPSKQPTLEPFQEPTREPTSLPTEEPSTEEDGDMTAGEKGTIAGATVAGAGVLVAFLFGLPRAIQEYRDWVGRRASTEQPPEESREEEHSVEGRPPKETDDPHPTCEPEPTERSLDVAVSQ